MLQKILKDNSRNQKKIFLKAALSNFLIIELMSRDYITEIVFSIECFVKRIIEYLGGYQLLLFLRYLCV